MNLVRPSNPHWYSVTETGAIVPCYSLPKKDGNGTKPPTLADARKMGLLPGISSIVNVLPKPNLVNWRITQAILSSLTLPRNKGESEDEYAQRVIEDAEAQSDTARTFGSQIHQAIEDHLNGIQRMPPHLEPYLAGFMDWAKENIEDIHALELVVGDPALGIAGKLDMDCTIRGLGRCVCDTKTQTIKKGFTTYPEWVCQLSAYEHCRRREDGIDRQLVSIVINSAKPDQPYIHHWLGTKETGWKIFRNCLEIWMFTNQFNPSHQI